MPRFCANAASGSRKSARSAGTGLVHACMWICTATGAACDKGENVDLASILNWVSVYGAPALFVLLMLGIVGLPIPDETLLVFSGYLIYRGTLHPATTWIFAFAGSACGITLSYTIGR